MPLILRMTGFGLFDESSYIGQFFFTYNFVKLGDMAQVIEIFITCFITVAKKNFLL